MFKKVAILFLLVSLLGCRSEKPNRYGSNLDKDGDGRIDGTSTQVNSGNQFWSEMAKNGTGEIHKQDQQNLPQAKQKKSSKDDMNKLKEKYKADNRFNKNNLYTIEELTPKEQPKK